MSKVYVGYGDYGLEQVDDEFIQFVLDVTISMANLSSDAEVGVVITTDSEMQKLNLKYRGKDTVTNVLSFGYLEITDEKFVHPGDENYIGDIYMSRTRIIDEAKKQKITEQEKFVQLFVHALLHLAGEDHDTDKKADEMEALEDLIIAKALE